MHCDHDMRHGNQPPAHLRQCDHGEHRIVQSQVTTHSVESVARGEGV